MNKKGKLDLKIGILDMRLILDSYLKSFKSPKDFTVSDFKGYIIETINPENDDKSLRNLIYKALTRHTDVMKVGKGVYRLVISSEVSITQLRAQFQQIEQNLTQLSTATHQDNTVRVFAETYKLKLQTIIENIERDYKVAVEFASKCSLRGTL